MAFFDKLRDKTSEMLEISKINNKINEEKNKIAAQKTKLADLYWERFEAGEQLHDEAMECCVAIKTSNQAIQAFNQEIIKLKEEPPQTVAATVGAAGLGVAAEEGGPCAACGSPVLPGKKFCPECGAPIPPPEPIAEEAPAAPAQEAAHCTACGEVVPAGKKFCSECGAPVRGD